MSATKKEEPTKILLRHYEDHLLDGMKRWTDRLIEKGAERNEFDGDPTAELYTNLGNLLGRAVGHKDLRDQLLTLGDEAADALKAAEVAWDRAAAACAKLSRLALDRFEVEPAPPPKPAPSSKILDASHVLGAKNGAAL